MECRKQILKRNKTIATGLLIAAALLFVVARSQKGSAAWEWAAAFAEAAMVGALADWFAVVALFRHPLGVPIPHTAIIKNKKDAIAGNLGNFIRDKFLAPETLSAKLRELNPAGRLAGYLVSRTNAEGLARGLSSVISSSLGFLDDSRVRNVLRTAIHDRIERFDLSNSAGILLETLRHDNRHQAVLDELLNRFAGWISTPQAQVRLAEAIDSMITKEYPLLSHFLPNRDQFAKGAGEKIVRRLNEYVQEINGDPAHEIRNTFDTAVSVFVDRLRSDQVLRDRIEAVKLEAVRNRYLSDYVENLAVDLKSWLGNDLKQTDSRVEGRIAEAVMGLGSALAANRELKESLNEHLEKLVTTYGDTVRGAIARHISGTVQQWEDDEYVSEIELSIGSDLQFIRMNGTLVGGAIGLLLHAVSLLFR
jgi:uncharacterized membrane-anchored protein YjiN (DUF445 family)